MKPFAKVVAAVAILYAFIGCSSSVAGVYTNYSETIEYDLHSDGSYQEIDLLVTSNHETTGSGTWEQKGNKISLHGESIYGEFEVDDNGQLCAINEAIGSGDCFLRRR